MKRIMHRYRNLMNAHNRTLFLLEITFLVLFIVFIMPLINYGMEYAMYLWGQSYITAENLVSFLLHPPTLLFAAFLIVIISFLLLFQLITMIHSCNSEKVNKKPNFLHLLMISVQKTKRCIFTTGGNVLLLFFSIFLFLFMNLPLLIAITIPANIGLPGGASDIMFVKGLFLLAFAMIGFIAFRGMFVIHFCINEHQCFVDSLELSKTLLRGRSLRTLRVLLLYNLGLTAGCFALYYIILFLVALFVFLFVDKAMVITVFLSAYPRINGAISIFFHMITFLTNLNIITTLYTKYREEELTDILPEKVPYPEQISLIRVKKHKHLLNSFFLFVIAAGVLNFYINVRNDSFYIKETFSGIQISSHRGNSHVAPENTLPALENAIIARSDSAEIDIRQTKDGVIVLLHDRNLFRTAGLNKNIWSLNLCDLAGLDAGSWFGNEFIKTKIPTLEEALILCKGRIKLNIEVKADERNLNLEETLVALISQYKYEYQCLISSSDYPTLVNVKKLNSKIKTGLIISAAYGNFYEKESIDFFSIRSRFITSFVVESAHLAGKEVHAWTVNNIGEIERMKSLGVDCIITNNPTLTRETLSRDDTSKTFIELLNRMLKNRTFFWFLSK